MSVHLYVRDHDEGRLDRMAEQLDDILIRLRAIQAQERQQMTSLTDLAAASAALKTSVESETNIVRAIKTLVEGQNAQMASLAQQLADALAANNPAEVRRLVDEIQAATALNAANAQELADLAVANTPAAA